MEVSGFALEAAGQATTRHDVAVALLSRHSLVAHRMSAWIPLLSQSFLPKPGRHFWKLCLGKWLGLPAGQGCALEVPMDMDIVGDATHLFEGNIGGVSSAFSVLCRCRAAQGHNA